MVSIRVFFPTSRQAARARQLKQQTYELDQKRIKLENRIRPLRKTRQIEEEEFQKRLEFELIKLKDKKPELFQITAQEQLTKLTVELGSTIIRWLIE